MKIFGRYLRHQGGRLCLVVLKSIEEQGLICLCANYQLSHMFFSISTIILTNWVLCRGPGLDRQARIQFGWVHFGVLSDLNDKNMLRHRRSPLVKKCDVTNGRAQLTSTVKKMLRCLREISPSQSLGSFPPVQNSFRWFRSKLSKICVYFL